MASTSERWHETFTVSALDQAAFRQLSGDLNPLHTDESAARAAGFDRPIVFGGLMIAKISAFLGNVFPGPGCVWTQLAIDFRQPLFVDQTANLQVEMTYDNPDLRIWDLAIVIYVDPAAPVATGSVRVTNHSGRSV